MLARAATGARKNTPALDPVQGRTRDRKGEAPPWCLDAELSATLDVKRLAAAALVLDVRVVEFEPFVEPFPCEVELGAVEIWQALRIDHDGDAMAFETMILGTNIVGVLELIGKPGTAGGAHAQSQRDTLPALVEEARDVSRRGLGQGNRHVALCSDCLIAFGGAAHGCGVTVLFPIVGDCRLDRILGENR